MIIEEDAKEEEMANAIEIGLNKLTYYNVFRSSNDVRRDIGEIEYLADAIRKNIIIVECKKIKKPKKIIESFNYGGDAHNSLCSYMYSVIKYCGGKPKSEQWHCGKRVDILSDIFSMIVECGDTAPDCIRQHLMDMNAVYVVPFQKIIYLNKYDLNTVENLIAFKFTCIDKKILKNFNDETWKNLVKQIKWAN